MKAKLVLPEEFDDYYAWEVEEKGVFFRATAKLDGREIPLTFYNPIRLAQDIEEEFRSRHSMAISNLVIVQRVTRDNMTAAVEAMGPEFFG